jgi:hypothetical protein
MNHILSFFKDRRGQWAIIQFPNPLLITWLVLIVVSLLVADNTLRSSVDQLKNAVLFAWSYLELMKGASYFRQLLGGTIMVMIIVGYFV